MSLINDFANAKKSSSIRYLLLIPFLLSWYNLATYPNVIESDSEAIYVLTNIPQGISLFMLVGAFLYFHRIVIRRFFIGTYLLLWLVPTIFLGIKELTSQENTNSVVRTILDLFGWPTGYTDPTISISPFTELFYHYSSDKSEMMNAVVYTPNWGVGFSWLMLSISSFLLLVLFILRIERQYLSDEPLALETSKPLAKPSHRLASVLVDAGLFVVTCGVGWFIWSIVLWNQGQTPGKLLLKIRVFDGDTGKPAKFAKMFRRQFVWENLVSFIFWPLQLIADASSQYFAWVALVGYLTIFLLSTALGLFDALLIFKGSERRRFTDRIENTYVVNEGSKEI